MPQSYEDFWRWQLMEAEIRMAVSVYDGIDTCRSDRRRGCRSGRTVKRKAEPSFGMIPLSVCPMGKTVLLC